MAITFEVDAVEPVLTPLRQVSLRERLASSLAVETVSRDVQLVEEHVFEAVPATTSG